MSAPRRLDLDGVLARHRAVLLDAYGVLVDGTRALPGAAALIARLQREGRPWLVVTNDASRSPNRSAARYQALGLPIPPERIQTSGMLLEREPIQGQRLLVLGPPDSRAYVAAAGAIAVGPEAEVDPERVDGVVIGDESGFDFVPGMDAALTLALHRLGRDLPLTLLLPNPDLVYPKSAGAFGLAAGSMAVTLEAALELRHPNDPRARFRRLGKPFAPIFHAALARLGETDAVMIGDQLATDIAGARRAGLYAALVDSGVGGAPPDPALAPHYRLSNLD